MKVVPQTITWVSCLSFRDVLPAKNARWVSLSELCVLLCQPFRGLWQRSWLRSLFLDWWGFLLPDWNGWNDRGVGKLKKGPMTHFYVFHNDAEKGALILHPCCGENSEIFLACCFWSFDELPSVRILFVSICKASSTGNGVNWMGIQFSSSLRDIVSGMKRHLRLLLWFWFRIE